MRTKLKNVQIFVTWKCIFSNRAIGAERNYCYGTPSYIIMIYVLKRFTNIYDGSTKCTKFRNQWVVIELAYTHKLMIMIIISHSLVYRITETISSSGPVQKFWRSGAHQCDVLRAATFRIFGKVFGAKTGLRARKVSLRYATVLWTSPKT